MLFHSRHFPIIHWRHSVTQYNFTATLELEQNFCTHSVSLSLSLLSSHPVHGDQRLHFFPMSNTLCRMILWCCAIASPVETYLHFRYNSEYADSSSCYGNVDAGDAGDKGGPNVNTISQYVRDGAKMYANNNWTIYLKLAHIKRMCNCGVYLLCTNQVQSTQIAYKRTQLTWLARDACLAEWHSMCIIV